MAVQSGQHTGGFRNSKLGKAQGVSQVSQARWESIRVSSKDSGVRCTWVQILPLTSQGTLRRIKKTKQADAGFLFYRHRHAASAPKPGHSGSFPPPRRTHGCSPHLMPVGTPSCSHSPRGEQILEGIQSKLLALTRCQSSPHTWAKAPHHPVWPSLAPVSRAPSHVPGAALQAEPPPTS